MTASPIEHPDCRCGHSHEQHAALSPQCSAARCECLRYQPAQHVVPAVSAPIGVQLVHAAPAKPPTPTSSGPTIDQILAAGRRSQFKRTVALAEKIAAELRDLRGRLVEERAIAEADRAQAEARAKALAEIAELEKKLAAAKAKLKDTRHAAGLPGGERTAGAGACPDCGELFDTAQRLGVHRRWKHDYRKNTAS
jgi:hypothetical protein